MINSLSQSTKNKIKGIIFGQAIGDALGLGTEFLNKEEVVKNYPDGLSDYDQIIQDKHRKRWSKGQWTDDTDQFLCILDSILLHKEINLRDIAKRFHEWFIKNPKGIGRTTYQVLSMPEYTKYPQKAAELVWKLKKKDAAPNGALMRNSILGIWSYWDLDKVLCNSEKVCELTHFDQRCKDSCKLMNCIISSELTGKGFIKDEYNNLLESYDPRLKEYLSAYLSPNIATLELDRNNIGYTLKALSAGLWAYHYAESFEHGLLEVINEGGDADTNGCVAGSLLGVRFGYNSIPLRWIDGLISKELLNEKYYEIVNILIDFEIKINQADNV